MGCSREQPPRPVLPRYPTFQGGGKGKFSGEEAKTGEIGAPKGRYVRSELHEAPCPWEGRYSL